MVTRLGPGAEFDLIRSLLRDRASTGHGVRLGPGDDCAVVEGDGIAVSVDLAVEDVHFRREWLPLEDIGYHAAMGALSDLAAVGARPIGALLSLALGPGDEAAAGKAVAGGAAEAIESLGGILLGGDVTRSPGPLVIDVAVVGEAREPVLRTGARPGDELWVTGRLGGAAAAVAAWLDGREADPEARNAYRRPAARTRESRWLAERAAVTAMVDLSDGIAGDAGHIAAASGVGVVIEAARLPVHPAAAGPNALRLAAAGGEDYELCFTAGPGTVEAVREAFEAEHGIPLTRVGRVEEGSGAVVVDQAGEVVELRAFQHWEDE